MQNIKNEIWYFKNMKKNEIKKNKAIDTYGKQNMNLE